MAAFSASGRRRSTTRRSRSDQHHAAIRHDDLSGDIVGVARREEGRDPRKVLGLRRIAEQDAGREALSMNSPFFLMTPLSIMSCSSPSHSGVTTTPGAKALTVILCLANSRAAAWVSEMTDALLAQ
jgi:hypothetical protein